MSLLPILFDDSSRLMAQHFGHGLFPEDLMASWAAQPTRSRDYYRPWYNLARTTGRHDVGSSIHLGKNKFQVCLDVQQFAPDEITVKTVGRQVVVEGKHEEKEDEHGHVSRHFVRKYQLPENHRPEDVVSSLTSDGVLSITAPRVDPPAIEGERIVPITAIGPAHHAVKKAPQQPEQNMEQ